MKIAVKAMNDTMGEHGLVPSRLVPGVLPRFPILNSALPEQRKILEIIKTAQAKINAIVAEKRIFYALAWNTSPSTSIL